MAGSPGGQEVGRVSIRVVPDTSKFRSELKKQLKEAVSGIKIEIPIKATVEGLKEELDKVKAEADKANAKTKVKVEVDGDGVTRETRRIKNLAQKLVGAIKLTVGINLAESIARIKTDLAIIKKIVKGYDLKIPIDFVGLTKWLGILAAVSGLLLAMPHLIGAIGGAVVVVGGLFATLPALIAGASLGIGALVVGMHGFFAALKDSGDAKKFEADLKKLTPSAQAAARALATFKQPLADIRKAVQEQLFKGMDKPLLSLKALLPPIKSGLVGAAGGIRDMGKEWIKMATSQKSVADLGIITKNNTLAFKNGKFALADFAAALKEIAVVGSDFLPGFGTGVSNLAQKFKDWAASARDTGKMHDWIQNALDKIRQLGRIIADIVVGFHNLFNALDSQGGGFLNIIERISQAFRDWSASKETANNLQALARVMRVVIDAAIELFGQIFKSAGEIFRNLEPFLKTFATTFGGVFAAAIRAVTPLLKSFAEWLSKNRDIMVPLIITVIALVTSFKLLATVAKGIVAIRDSFLAIKAASSIIGGIITDIGKFIVSLTKAVAKTIWWAIQTIIQFTRVAVAAAEKAVLTASVWITQAAKSAAFTARYFAIMAAQAVAQFVKVAVAASVNAIKTAAIWVAQMTIMAAETIAKLATTVAAWIAGWIAMAAASLAQAARMAGAWLIAMGPIALVIAAIVGLVALIIANWDSIVAGTRAAWDAVWRFVSDIITNIVTFLGHIKDAIDSVVRWFASMGQGIVDGVQAGLNWLGGVKDAILGFFRGAGTWLFETGKNLVLGLWNGWKAYFSNFKQAAIRDGNGLVDSINGIFGVFSPSRVFRKIGEYLGQGLEIGFHSSMQSAIKSAVSNAKNLTSAFDDNLNVSTEWITGLGADIGVATDMLKKFDSVMPSNFQTEFTSQVDVQNFTGIGDQIADAMDGVEVKMDSKPVGQLINNNRIRDKRRRG